MGNNTGKTKNGKHRNGRGKSVSDDPFTIKTTKLCFGFVRKFQQTTKFEINIMNSSKKNNLKGIIYLIIAFYPRKYSIYGIGGNQFGEFGLGHTEEINKFTNLQSFSRLVDHPNNIYRGYGRFMIKTIFGEIYSCGNNYRGDLGTDLQDIRHTDKFDKIACTDENTHDLKRCHIVGDGVMSNHVIIQSDNNNYNKSMNYYAFGSNRRGQFGNYKDKQHYRESNFKAISLTHSLQSLLHRNESIIQIQCGQYHTIFLTDHGNVFTCGDNMYGQCGIIKRKDGSQGKYLPLVRNQYLKNITDIATGAYHCLCVNNKRELFVFGDNPNGQLGFDNKKMKNIQYEGGGNSANNKDEDEVIFVPQVHSYFKEKNTKIMSIACGNCHSCVVDYAGNCYLFGDNRWGQIGNGGKFCEKVCKPHVFNQWKKFDGILIDEVSLGYNHTVLMSHVNEIYTFGDNQYHQCSSNNNVKRVGSPWLLSRKEIGIDSDCVILKVIAGSDSTIVITK